MTRAGRRVDAVIDGAARLLGLERNPSGVIFGSITVGALLAAETSKGESFARGVVAAVLVLLLYWVVRGWSHDAGERLEQRRTFRWARFGGSLLHEASILRGTVLPVVGVLIAGAAGSGDDAALWAGTAVSAGSLVVIEFLAAMRNRLTGAQVAAQTTAGALFGLALLGLRLVLH